MDTYSKCNDVDSAFQVFKELPDQSRKSFQGDAEDGTYAARRGNDDYRKRTADGDRSMESSDGEYRKRSAAKGSPFRKER